jgi:SagB-type dehydrogenase family enzyme
MEIIKLPEPAVRISEIGFEQHTYGQRGSTYLPIPDRLLMSDEFFEILQRRRTRRTFGRLSLDSLSNLLWFSAKSHLSWREPSGFLWQHRCSPSAGGRQPIDVIVIAPPTMNDSAYIYDSISHCLRELVGVEEATSRFISELDNVVPIGEGTVLWFVAQYQRTSSKYLHPESLVWRDAGALLATVCFSAEALELNCCPYGVNGDTWVAEAFEDISMGGVGGCVVGSRQEFDLSI